MNKEQTEDGWKVTFAVHIIRHKWKIFFGLAFFIMALLVYGVSTEGDSVRAFLSTSIVDIEIGHLLLILIFYRFIKE